MPLAPVTGGTIYYETAGEGLPLILLHGIGSNSRSWRRQLEGLSSGFKVVAWDAPGYGRSSDPAGHSTFSGAPASRARYVRSSSLIRCLSAGTRTRVLA